MSFYEARRHHDRLFDEQAVTYGGRRPFSFPFCFLGAGAALTYLLLDPHSRALRWMAFLFVVGFQLWCVLFTRARNPAAAYGIGIISSWGCLWLAFLGLFNNCQTEFWRVKRDGKREIFPDRFGIRRVYWVLDLVCSVRGVGWNWEVDGIPPVPGPGGMTTGKSGVRRFGNRRELVRKALAGLLCGYLALDALACVMHSDEYFWTGDLNASLPEYVEGLIPQGLAKGYRLLLSLAGLYTALYTIFKLAPIVFVGLLGPGILGLKGEAVMNPLDMFGDASLILDHGLAGWWGGWWHQTFRASFKAPAKAMISGTRTSSRSITGRLMSAAVAFFLSGLIHAAGSHTQTGHTRPLAPFLFFNLQTLGIILQQVLIALCEYVGIASAPRWPRRLCNLTYTYLWFYITTPLLLNDLARGGVWLLEPVPISPLTALGFGPDDDWFRWRNLVTFKNPQWAG
ncbi:hypothetical protein K470DRAFT_216218 [Piedraia hortae CBS 480.64]|uniref:Wax synthase domain-containing protein n=1 Tax=Piedraia hortae CBS 480.64 TaxID=1314780 RepID=A0A6A7C0T7_9PEZI|nr:hypothetical protein K470DRAFT_216218 [Piedraia hortae CBS 480.64]